MTIDSLNDTAFKTELLHPPTGAYLNTAAESPLLRSVGEALTAYANDKAKGEPGRAAFEARVEAARGRVATLLEGRPASVGFCYTASDALGLLTQSIPWREGDRVVVSDIEYPSDVLVWSKLAGTRVELDLVEEKPGNWNTEAVLEKIGPRTRLVVVSAVSYRTGFRVDLRRIKEAVNAQGGWLLADATQAMGAVPIRADEADMMVASGFKWMMGVHGLGVAYVDERIVEQLEPPFAGWRSVDQAGAPGSVKLKPDAQRFEMGMPGFPAIYALEAGLSYLEERPGLSIVWSRVDGLAGLVVERLSELGVPLITPSESKRRAGIVCFHHREAKALMQALKQDDVYVYAPVDDVLRISPHFFNTADDIEALVAALKKRLAGQ